MVKTLRLTKPQCVVGTVKKLRGKNLSQELVGTLLCEEPNGGNLRVLKVTKNGWLTARYEDPNAKVEAEL